MTDNKAEKSVLSLLGIAQKAGKVQSGEFCCETAVKDSTACLVIIAEDASDNTKKLFSDKSKFYKVPCVTFSTKDDLGHAIGRKERASVAVTDEGLAQAIFKKINDLKSIEEEPV